MIVFKRLTDLKVQDPVDYQDNRSRVLVTFIGKWHLNTREYRQKSRPVTLWNLTNRVKSYGDEIHARSTNKTGE